MKPRFAKIKDEVVGVIYPKELPYWIARMWGCPPAPALVTMASGRTFRRTMEA